MPDIYEWVRQAAALVRGAARWLYVAGAVAAVLIVVSVADSCSDRAHADAIATMQRESLRRLAVQRRATLAAEREVSDLVEAMRSDSAEWAGQVAEFLSAQEALGIELQRTITASARLERRLRAELYTSTDSATGRETWSGVARDGPWTVYVDVDPVDRQVAVDVQGTVPLIAVQSMLADGTVLHTIESPDTTVTVTDLVVRVPAPDRGWRASVPLSLGVGGAAAAALVLLVLLR